MKGEPVLPGSFLPLLRLARAASFGSRGLGERLRCALPYPRLGPPAWTPLARSLAESRVTIVAACGVEPVASPGRVLPGGVHPVDAETGGLRLEPFDGDGAAARRDPNVLFPLERLREIERRGAIGGCSDVHFVGSDDPRRLAPGRAAGAIADALADRRVDSVLCCGCGGGGAFLACVLAREIEDRGFSTVAVVGPLRAAQRLRPPRALFVPSRSTRLFGDPGEKALQSDILLFALRRLEAAQRPGDIARFTRRMGPTGARGPDD